MEVIGCGYLGRNIVRNLSEIGSLRTVCGIDTEKLDFLDNEYPEIHTTSNVDEVLDVNAINAVVIAAPAVDHYGLVKNTLLSDKDVLVEKTSGIGYR